MEAHFLLLCFFVSGSYADCDFRCNNGRCIQKSYLCDGYDDCPDNEDEKDCYMATTTTMTTTTTTTTTMKPTTTAFPCQEGESLCASGKCIPTAWVCDSHSDCPGGDDENNCTSVQDNSPQDGPVLLALNSSSNASCTSEQFFCDNGTCIPNTWVCDSYSDCQSGEDEAQCPSIDNSTQDGPVLLVLNSSSNASCTSEQFACGEGKCIPNAWVCDSYSDCQNGEDEAQCPSTDNSPQDGPVLLVLNSSSNASCTSEQFSCDNGMCIWNTWVCDSDSDCQNGEDEAQCPSTDNSPQDGPVLLALNSSSNNSPQDGPVLLALNSSSNASCTSEQFSCDNETCIPNAWVCDSYSDCRSGEDEAQCPSIVKPNDFPSCDMTHCSACFSKKIVGPSGCPKDFVKFKDTCLWINVFPNPWEIAQKICQSQESKFASIPPNEQLMEFLIFLKQKDLIGLNYWVAGAGDSGDFPERKMETHHEFYEHLMKKEGFVKSVNHIDKCNYLHNSLPEIFRSPECADYAGVICEWINPRKLQ